MKREIVTFYEDRDMKVDIELMPHQGVYYLFVHVDVYNFSKQVYRLLKSKWDDLKKASLEEGYEYISAYTQNDKFTKRFGEPVNKEVVTEGNDDYLVYTWRL